VDCSKSLHISVGKCGRADSRCERLGVAPANPFDGWQKQLARTFDGPSQISGPLYFQIKQSQVQLRDQLVRLRRRQHNAVYAVVRFPGVRKRSAG
jgi:hypothetical protein